MTERKRTEDRMAKRMTNLMAAAGVYGKFKRDVSEESDVSSMTDEQKRSVLFLSDEDLVDDPLNAAVYRAEPDDDLVRAMKEYGFRGVILAYPLPDGKYMIESGHRRREAARKAGIKELPVYVTEPPETESSRIIRLHLGNLHGRKLPPTVSAALAQSLYDAHGKELEEKRKSGRLQEGEETRLNVLVASDMEISDANVERLRALLKLIPELRTLADSGNLSWSELSTASVLDESRQKELFGIISEKAEKSGYGPITRDWLRKEIKSLKADMSGEPKPEEPKKTARERRNPYAPRTVMRNARSVTEMISDMRVPEDGEAQALIVALEGLRTAAEAKLKELKGI